MSDTIATLSSWKAKYKSFVMSFPRLHTRYDGIYSFHRRPAKTCAILFRYKETHEVHLLPVAFYKKNHRKKIYEAAANIGIMQFEQRERGDYSVMVNVIVWHHRGPLPDMKLISGWSMIIHIF